MALKFKGSGNTVCLEVQEHVCEQREFLFHTSKVSSYSPDPVTKRLGILDPPLWTKANALFVWLQPC